MDWFCVFFVCDLWKFIVLFFFLFKRGVFLFEVLVDRFFVVRFFFEVGLDFEVEEFFILVLFLLVDLVFNEGLILFVCC